jgi:hypothetical protein
VPVVVPETYTPTIPVHSIQKSAITRSIPISRSGAFPPSIYLTLSYLQTRISIPEIQDRSPFLVDDEFPDNAGILRNSAITPLQPTRLKHYFSNVRASVLCHQSRLKRNERYSESRFDLTQAPEAGIELRTMPSPKSPMRPTNAVRPLQKGVWVDGLLLCP